MPRFISDQRLLGPAPARGHIANSEQPGNLRLASIAWSIPHRTKLHCSTTGDTLMIDDLYRYVPEALFGENGRVFYSGRDAFNNSSRVYLLGLNPGGSPLDQAQETVSSHSIHVLQDERHNWSAFRDESWLGARPGSLPMQRRVLHLLDRLELDAGEVPSSNLVFVRSNREVNLNGRTQELAAACWEFHRQVISRLNVEVVVCFGKTTGDWVRSRLGAHSLVETFVENNARRWTSHSFRNASGLGVVVATHPSIADWTTASADPTNLIVDLMRSPVAAGWWYSHICGSLAKP